jgi:hypothetical protein
MLPLGIHKMDQVKAIFFGEMLDEFKYHMVRWLSVCHPKKFDGIGIINTQIFNECLITKWIYKIYNQAGSPLVRLLKAKYIRDDDFYKSRLEIHMDPSFGKVSTKLSTFLNGGLCIKLVMID